MTARVNWALDRTDAVLVTFYSIAISPNTSPSYLTLTKVKSGNYDLIQSSNYLNEIISYITFVNTQYLSSVYLVLGIKIPAEPCSTKYIFLPESPC